MKTLFDVTKLSNITLKNRFFRSATWEELANQDGRMTDELFSVYEGLVKGGVGAIITGYAYIMESGKATANMMGIYDDKFIDEYRKLTDKVHEYGSAIIMQIVHCGSSCAWKASEKRLLAPSAIENPAFKTIPAEMTKEEIKLVIKAFADAAARVKKAGFDGVQLHAAHGFLLSQFLNPALNKRSDEYGGTLENRSRIVIETYKAVRKAVGDDFAVMAKVNCDDFMENGLNFEESLEVCRTLSELGIDMIEVSGGSFLSREGESPARDAKKESYFREYGAKIAERVKAPVVLVGGNRDAGTMNDILTDGKIEYFSMSRPFLCEPDLANRWKNGDPKKSKCISCNQCFGVVGKTCIFNRKK